MKKPILSLLTAILVFGTPNVASAENKPFSPPVSDSYITRNYSKEHRAIDYQRRKHDAGFVGSIGNGKVIKVCKGYCGGYGYYVVVDHGNGYKSLYAHLSGVSVANGQIVKTGSKVGNMGKTGRVCARWPILHFEVIKNNEKINPLNVIK